MPVNPSEILALRPTLMDHQQLQQAFLAKQAADQQALQTGAIDQQTKANAFKTQLLYAAAQTGDQNIYDNTKAKLGQFGIDTSDFAPDVATGTKQADAARLASSPLGSLLNTATKFDANNIAAATAAGQVPQNPNGVAQALLGGNFGPLTGQASSPQINQPVAASASRQLAVPANGTDANTIAANLVQTGALNGPGMTMGLPNRADAKYNDPTRTQAANQALFSADLDTAKANPAYEQAVAKATNLGKSQADVQKDAIGSKESMDQVNQNLDAIIKLAPTLPQQRFLIGPDTRASLNQNFGDQQMANAYKQFGTINEAQTINAIKALASTGQIRMNQRMEGMINRGYLVDPSASPEEKINQANAIKTELANAATNAQNVNAQMNGGQTQPYSSVPTGLNTNGPVKVSSPAEAAQLPTGTQFITPEGKIRIKH